MKTYMIIAAILAAPIAASATGSFQCEVTEQAQWLDEAELKTVVADLGWEMRKFKADGGCWEVYATMSDGARIEAYLHPVSGEVQYIGQRGTVLFDIREDGPYTPE